MQQEAVPGAVSPVSCMKASNSEGFRRHEVSKSEASAFMVQFEERHEDCSHPQTLAR